jgi:peptidoglycan hydrolase-like protein with peptidoglycan-binding domain
MPARLSPQPAGWRVAIVAAAAGAAVFGGAALQPAAASASSQSPEAAYLAALNQERAAHGLRPLIERQALNGVASSWASHMAASSTLSHNPHLAAAVSNWQALGENVGDGPDIQSLDRAFWTSPEHRANILDPSYSDVGIGAVTRDGVIWITIDFRDPMHAITPHSSDRPLAKRVVCGEQWTATTPPQRHRVLRVGSQGHDVARVQRHLHVTADGIFGRITRGAVERFQRRHTFRPTGVVGHRTWRAITR